MKTFNQTSVNSIIIGLTMVLMNASNLSAQTADKDFFNEANTFFSKQVDEEGLVSYENIKNTPEVLNNLYANIANHNLKDKSDDYVKAFYTNAYNILVIKQVVDRYPIDGPLTVNGFFDNIKHTVAGEQLTLNQVEKDKNLYVNKDERLHFALVCAAISCPPLANFAYFPEKIEEQLDERTRLALNNPEFIRATKKGVELSQIFNWYKDDFNNKVSGGIPGYINKYRKNQIPTDKKNVYYEYNWLLNKK